MFGLLVPALLNLGAVFALRTFPGLALIIAFAVAVMVAVHVDAFRVARHKRETPRSTLTRWPVSVAVPLLMWFAVTPGIKATLPFRAYRIPSPAMRPTLQIGDVLMATRVVFGKPRVSRCDIVIFRSPVNPREDYIKRVVAVARDTVEIRSKCLLVNGKELAEPYIVHVDAGTMGLRDDFGPVTVPSHCVFVLGDNRDNSLDSRFFGFVNEDSIRGRALYVYFGRTRDRLGKRLDAPRPGPAASKESPGGV